MLALLAGAAEKGGDPNFAHPNQVVTVAREGYSIAGLVTHAQVGKTFKYGVALFPGHPGIMKLREQDGKPVFELGGNFLVRSRRHWLDDETLVLVIDAPSDQWASFEQWFRERARYGADVAALVSEVGRRYGISDWSFVGTSEGSISAFHAARMNPSLAKRAILTSSLFLPSKNGPGLSNAKWDALAAPILWVHHKNDPCDYTPYREAKKAAAASHSPLLTVDGGGPGTGNPCEARSAHGYIGVEIETVKAMRAWIKTGGVPPDIVK
jgi:predicted esterase